MVHVHVLTEGVAPNVRAVLFPLTVHRRALRERGIEWRAFRTPTPAMFECDVLVVESNVHGQRWTADTDGVLAELEDYASRVDRLCYLDSSDSTALLHPEVLPLVDRYYKGQLLADRGRYRERHYGRRLFTDYAHRTFGVDDAAPEDSVPVADAGRLGKLGVWWNAALADWSPWGRYRMELFARLPAATLLPFPGGHVDSRRPRPNEVSCRMATRYARETVAWHRRRATEALSRWAPADRISHRAYVRELRSSRLVVSPFGWGEINYKDFETFLAGAALVKPDMSHLETWPDLYRENETYAAYAWDTQNLASVIERLLDDPETAASIAAAGQAAYRSATAGPSAEQAFCARLERLLAPSGDAGDNVRA